MQHVNVVDVRHAQQDKVEDLFGLVLAHGALLLQQRDELVALDVLAHDEVLVVPDLAVDVFHHLRRVQLLEHFDLGLDVFDADVVFGGIFDVYDLHCHLLLTVYHLAQLHCPECTLTKFFYHFLFV